VNRSDGDTFIASGLVTLSLRYNRKSKLRLERRSDRNIGVEDQASLAIGRRLTDIAVAVAGDG
jgi:hypothetical protein